MTLSEHIEMGRKIKQIQKLHADIYNKIACSYGKTSRAGKLAQSFIKPDNLKAEMDMHVCRETDLPTWQQEGYTAIYYGADINDLRKSRGLDDV